MIKYYSIGDKVTLTPQSFRNIVDGNKSIHAFPCDAFVKRLRPHIGETGEVTMLFPPGYSYNCTFPNGDIFQFQGGWIENF